MASYKYKNLVILWQEQEWDMLARASSEIAAMLTEMGIPEGEYYNLSKPDRFISVSYHRIKSPDVPWERSGFLITVMVPTGLEGNLAANYREITDADSAVHLHYALREDYQKYRTIHKLIK